MITTLTPPSVNQRNVCRVVLSGGLGNQMFQYAAAAAVAARTNADVEIDSSFYQKRHRRHRSLELTAFPITGRIAEGRSSTFLGALKSRLRFPAGDSKAHYHEPHFHFDRGSLDLRAPVSMQGYFQSEKYFESISVDIRKQFRVPQPADPRIRDLKRLLEEACSLHVRRGDYVSKPKNRGIYAECTLQYYRDAIDRLPSGIPIFVFSDDPDWVRQNLNLGRELLFPEANSAMEDLWLMTQARHHVIANSTFSWWGAWLSRDGDGITIAPRQWFCDSAMNDADLIPEPWIRV